MSSSRFLPGRKSFLAAVPAALLLAALALNVRGQNATNDQQTNVPPRPRNPTIILIVADDLGWGDLGCYGQTKIKTTNLDALAASGMRFTSFYAGSSLSTPSRTSLLTGMDTGHSANRGYGVYPQPIPGTQPLISQLLKERGYATTAIGKWGLGSGTPPGKRAFDDWVGALEDGSALNYYPPTVSRWHLGKGKGDVTMDTNASIYPNENGQQGEYSDDVYAGAAMNAVRVGQPRYFNSYRGMFLYFAPTLPYASPENGPGTTAGAVVPDVGPYGANTAWLPAERTRAAMITRLDDYVGRLTNSLQELKFDRNTMVIFTSATGPQHDNIDPAFFHSAGPFRGFKHDLYEGGIRVPLIISWPLQVRAGSVSDLPCAAWDLLPTLMEAAHRSTPDGVDGISFLPTLTGGSQTNRHDFLYWELHDHGFKQAVRMDNWKAVRNGIDGQFELYDLKSDPGEKTDVATDHQEVVGKIAALVKMARTDSPDWPVPTAGDK